MTQPAPDFEGTARSAVVKAVRACDKSPFNLQHHLEMEFTAALRQAYQAGLLAAARIAEECVHLDPPHFEVSEDYTKEEIAAAIRAASLGGSHG